MTIHTIHAGLALALAMSAMAAGKNDEVPTWPLPDRNLRLQRLPHTRLCGQDGRIDEKLWLTGDSLGWAGHLRAHPVTGARGHAGARPRAAAPKSAGAGGPLS
jgi:hypothetical protein